MNTDVSLDKEIEYDPNTGRIIPFEDHGIEKCDNAKVPFEGIHLKKHNLSTISHKTIKHSASITSKDKKFTTPSIF